MLTLQVLELESEFGTYYENNSFRVFVKVDNTDELLELLYNSRGITPLTVVDFVDKWKRMDFYSTVVAGEAYKIARDYNSRRFLKSPVQSTDEYLKALRSEYTPDASILWSVRYEPHTMSFEVLTAIDPYELSNVIYAVGVTNFVIDFDHNRNVHRVDCTSDEHAERAALSVRNYIKTKSQRDNAKKSAPYNILYGANHKSLSAILTANEDVHINEAGGAQSYTPARFDLLPPEALASIALVLGHGATKYGANNWRKIPTDDHVNHAMQHLCAYLASPNQEDLSHAACRLLFALELALGNNLQESTPQPEDSNVQTQR